MKSMAIGFCLAMVLGAGADLRGISSQDEDARRRIDGWIESLGSDDLTQREDAHRRLSEPAKDLRFVLPELEAARASSNEAVRRRSNRIVRSLRENLAISPVHAVRPAFDPEDLNIFDGWSSGSAKTLLELYDVHDAVEKLGGAQLVNLVKEVQRGKWDSHHTAEVTPNNKMFVVASPEIHRSLRALLGEHADRAARPPAKREGVEKELARLGDPREGEPDAAEARLSLLGLEFKTAREALKRCEGAKELEVRTRAAAILGDYDACRKALSGHHERRRAVLARLQLEGESLDLSAVPEIIRNALEPCEATEVRVDADPAREGLLQGRSETFWIVLKKSAYPYFGDPPPATTVGLSIPRKGGVPAALTLSFER